MDYSLWIDEKFIPAERVGWPARFRVGFRGPGPATREAGTVQLKIDDRDLYWQHSSDKIEVKQEVWIDRGSQRIFRGAISYKDVDLKRNWIQLQAKEQSSLLKDGKIGMDTVGEAGGWGMPNPMRYLWTRDENIFDTTTAEESSEFGAILDEKYQGLPKEEQVTYEKDWIFSSHFWHAWVDSSSFIKSVSMKSQPVIDVIGALIRQWIISGEGSIGFDALAWSGFSCEGQFHVQDTNGEALEISADAGLVKQGDYIFVYWFVYEEDGANYINVAQIVNRSLAVYLGKFAGWPRKSNREFYIVKNTRDPAMLAFYQIQGLTPPLLELQITYVQIRDSLFLRAEHATCPSSTVLGPWLCSTPEELWTPQLTPTPQLEKNLSIEDGQFFLSNLYQPWAGYEIRAFNVGYKGNLGLNEIAYDFKGANFAGILGEIAYVNGCDWWVDSQGILHVQRIDGMPTEGVISGQILEEREIEEELLDKEFEYDLSGIPIGSTHARLLAEAWAQKRREVGKSKRLEVLVLGDIGAELGQRVEIEGSRHGVLEAMEFEKEKVILETRV